MRTLSPLALLAVLTASAWAEPVTYHWTGNIIDVTDGTNGTADLRGTFSIGQAATFDMTVERATSGAPFGSSFTEYVNAITQLTATIGTYSFSGTFPTTTITIGNDAPDNGFLNDSFFTIVQPLEGDPIGPLNLSDANFSFYDPQGAAFTSGILPRPFPLLSFETRGVDVSWGSLSTQGVVRVEFSAGTTPALGTTWGRIKTDYR